MKAQKVQETQNIKNQTPVRSERKQWHKIKLIELSIENVKGGNPSILFESEGGVGNSG